VDVAAAAVSALKMQPTKQPLQSAMSRATRVARMRAPKVAMSVALSVRVAPMKTATMRPWSKTAKPLSV
jgi:hypothetical protein